MSTGYSIHDFATGYVNGDCCTTDMRSAMIDCLIVLSFTRCSFSLPSSKMIYLALYRSILRSLIVSSYVLIMSTISRSVCSAIFIWARRSAI